MFPEGRALEFLIAAIVALVVVGPKDLPMLLRKLGQFMAKVRSMAAEFRASFDEMARQSELDELRKEVEAMRNAQMSDIAKNMGVSELNQSFDEMSQGLSDVGVHMTPTGYQYPGPQTEPEGEAAPPRPKRARRVAAKPIPPKKTPAKAAPKKAPTKAAAARSAPAKTAAKPKPAPKPKASAETATPARPRVRKTAGSVT